MTDQFQVHEEKPDHHYRTEIPNIVFHLGLDIIAIAIYAYLKRIAGDYRSCYKSQKKICSELGISPATYIKYRDQLGLEHSMLGGKKLLNIMLRKKDDGNNETTLITIVDIWRDNGDYFRQDPHSKSERPPIQNMNDPHSKSEYKEEPLKKNPSKETTTPKEAKASVDVSLFKYIEGIPLHLQIRLVKEHSKEDLEKAVAVLKASKVPISNPYGFIVSAIGEGYNPSVTPEEKAEQLIGEHRSWTEKHLIPIENLKIGPGGAFGLAVMGKYVEICSVTTSKTFEYKSTIFLDEIKAYLKRLAIEL